MEARNACLSLELETAALKKDLEAARRRESEVTGTLEETKKELREKKEGERRLTMRLADVEAELTSTKEMLQAAEENAHSLDASLNKMRQARTNKSGWPFSSRTVQYFRDHWPQILRSNNA